MKFLMLGSILIYFLSGALSLFAGRRYPWSESVVPFSSVLASVTGAIPVLWVLFNGGAIDFYVPWHMPLGAFHLRMDLLSAWFALPLLLVSPLISLYGRGYMRGHMNGIPENAVGFFLQFLSGGILFVLLASDGILFLFAWEIMSMAAFFLVVHDHGEADSRRAGFVYLIATHLGTAFLFAMFLILGARSGSFDFGSFGGLGGLPDLIFLLGLVGFGAKAGFFGLHVWLPEAHPAAPSHASALMSGVMIKTGIYGIVRLLLWADAWPVWWGWSLVAIGVASGVGGVMYAVVQRDLKRLLAYSSVENIGIICLGLGVGVLGSRSASAVSCVALAGALVHVVNHSLFKSGLFLGAGAVISSSGTGNLNRLGGLSRQMPRTSLFFLLFCLAVCGLPPLNGFTGEFLIYLASYRTVVPHVLSSINLRVGGFVVISALALIGGLAAMGFVKAYGAVFLGEPRSGLKGAEDPKTDMLFPMAFFSAACLALGLLGSLLICAVEPVAAFVRPLSVTYGEDILSGLGWVYLKVSMASVLFLLSMYGLWRLRKAVQMGRSEKFGPTWGCGYPYGSSRVQYTGSSFSQPLTVAFRSVLRTDLGGCWPEGYFPKASSFWTDTPGIFTRRVYEPLFAFIMALTSKTRKIQHGGTHLYVFYILVALVAVLFWSLL